MERRLVLRRLLLIGTPLVLVPLMVLHQLIDQFERPGAPDFGGAWGQRTKVRGRGRLGR